MFIVQNSEATVTDSKVWNHSQRGFSVLDGSRLSLERVTILGCGQGLVGDRQARITATNVLIAGTNQQGVRVARGSILDISWSHDRRRLPVWCRN